MTPFDVNGNRLPINTLLTVFILQVSAMPRLEKVVHRRWPDLLGPGIVAVSGGADSVALLRVLAARGTELIVGHVNHRLRGEHSDADEQFVHNLAGALGLTCKSIGFDIAGEAGRSGANLEEFARKRRYDYLIEVAKESGANWIATGHTADDQAETVLHRLLRGTGIQGLRGIARERELGPGLRLIRPLIEATRGDVLDYLESLNQPWREDASNCDRTFTRNRIRHELLPLMRTFNPAIGEVLGRLAEQANELYAEQEGAARKLLCESELPAAGSLRIFQTAALREAAPETIRGLFRLVWEREGWPMGDMTFSHWKRLVGIVLGDDTATDLPGGIHARRRESIVQVGK